MALTRGSTLGVWKPVFVLAAFATLALAGHHLWQEITTSVQEPRKALLQAWNDFRAAEREQDARRDLWSVGDGASLWPVIETLGRLAALWGRPRPQEVLALFDGTTDPESSRAATRAYRLLAAPRLHPGEARRAAEALRRRRQVLHTTIQACVAGLVEAAALCTAAAVLTLSGLAAVVEWIAGRRRTPGRWVRAASTRALVGDREADTAVWRPGPPMTPSWKARLSRHWRGLPRRLRGPTALQVLRVLIHHRHLPAATEGGHDAAPGGLLNHSLAVAHRILERLPTPEALVVGLAHDLGKTVTMRRLPSGAWTAGGEYHDRYGGVLLHALPALHREFPPSTVEAILCAVRFHHCPDDLPLNAPEGAAELLAALRAADRAAARTRTGSHSGPEEPGIDRRRMVEAALPAALHRLTDRDVLFDPENGIAWVKERSLRCALAETLGGEAAAALKGEHARVPHPWWEDTVLPALRAMELLRPPRETHEPGPCLFTITLEDGAVLPFRVPLDPDRLPLRNRREVKVTHLRATLE